MMMPSMAISCRLDYSFPSTDLASRQGIHRGGWGSSEERRLDRQCRCTPRSCPGVANRESNLRPYKRENPQLGRKGLRAEPDAIDAILLQARGVRWAIIALAGLVSR
jgi:hypothetical protein